MTVTVSVAFLFGVGFEIDALQVPFGTVVVGVLVAGVVVADLVVVTVVIVIVVDGLGAVDATATVATVVEAAALVVDEPASSSV